MGDLISIGKILNFHGIKGEVKLGYTKGNEELLEGLVEGSNDSAPQNNIYAKKDNQNIPLHISSIRFHKGFALVKFKELNSINEVMELKGAILYTGKEIVANELQEDEFLTSDLKGLDVFDTDGNKLGVVVGVSDNGATDLLSVKVKDKSVHLVPFVKELVPSVDIKNNSITVKNIDGLIPKF